jgi:hypothetical protein
MATDNCVICKYSASLTNRGDVNEIKCPRCGSYEITGTAAAVLAQQDWGAQQLANACGWMREHQGARITNRDIEALLSLPTPAVDERAMRILAELERGSTNLCSTLNFEFSSSPLVQEWLGFSWSQDFGELRYLVIEYLIGEGLLKGNLAPGGKALINATITPKGHSRLADLRAGGAGSTGFCAMWFDESITSTWTDAIKPAIEAAGYSADRIDQREHNNKIDDEIVAAIRRSRFIVADFTGLRGGVYFEAGFALGLNIPVIWTIREDEIDKVHFDSRQYNFILWSDAKLAEFKVKLQNRIEATIGKGPRAGNAG